MAESMIPKAALWVGDHDVVVKNVIAFLQKIYCKKNCATCVICQQIETKQFHEICWLNSGGDLYKLDDLSFIEEQLLYIRDVSTQFFFILDHAELLSATCSNKLLKSLEDSAPGYHFILITNRESVMLPTIKSRCFVYHVHEERKNLLDKDSLVTFFLKEQLPDISFFNELVERYKSGQEPEILSGCHALLQKFLIYYSEKKSESEKKIILDRIEYLKNVILKGIPPGSAPLILRSMYLRWRQMF